MRSFLLIVLTLTLFLNTNILGGTPSGESGHLKKAPSSQPQPKKVTTQTVNITPQNQQWATGCAWNSVLLGINRSDDQISSGTSGLGVPYVGYVVFDISNIPQNAIIQSVVIHVYVNGYTGDTLGTSVYISGHDPRNSANEAWGWGYWDGLWFAPKTVGWHSQNITNLGTIASDCATLQKQLRSGYSWWAVGWYDASVPTHGLDNFDGYSSNNRPYCTVTYSLPYIDLGSQISTLGAAAGSKVQFAVSSNISWQISASAPWLGVSPTSGAGNAVVTLTANTANTSTSPRSASITISGNGAAIVGPVSQAGQTSQMSITPANATLGAASGSSAMLNVTSNTNWSVTSNVSWLVLSQSQGAAGTTSLKVTANSANTSTTTDRQGNLTFSAGNIKGAATITQSHTAQTLSVTTAYVDLNTASGSAGSFGISSNISWSITGIPSWLSLSQSSGSGNATITATATSTNTNTSEGASREATLMVSGGGITVKVYVSQDFTHILSVTPASVTLQDSVGASAELQITTNTDWTVNNSASWLNVSPTVGAVNWTIKVTATSINTSASSRATVLTFSSSPKYNLSSSVTINQAGLPSSVVQLGGLIPDRYSISQNYPNPFNPTTNIRFQLPKRSFVTLDIFNALGQRVMRLVDGELLPGNYVVTFNASLFDSGVYLYRITAGSYMRTRKMLFVK